MKESKEVYKVIKNKQKYLLGVIFSLVIIGYVIFRMDWQEVRRIFTGIQWYWAAAAFGAYYLNYIFRTLRFQRLFSDQQLPFWDMLGVTNQYGMFLYLMPAKFGEVTFPLLVKSNLGVDLSFSTGVLIAARIFDFLAISIILPIAIIPYWSTVPPGIRLASILFSLLVYIIFLLFIWSIRHQDTIRSRFLEREYQSKISFGIQKFLDGAYQGLQIVQRRRLYWKLFFLTLGIWFCINFNLYLITLSLGYQISLYQVVVVSIIMIPITLFPVQGFANLGSHEVGWVTAFSLFGYSYHDALNIAISSHFVSIFFVLILGVIGTLLLNPRWRSSI